MTLSLPLVPRMRPISIVALGIPRTKKNSPRVFGNVPLPSAEFVAWEKSVVPQMQESYSGACGFERTCCRKCNGSGRVGRNPSKTRRCPRCHGQGEQWAPLTCNLNLAAVFYRDRNVGDLVNYLEAVCDALETAGVVLNDKQIAGLDGCRLDKDAARPRVEMVLTEIA